MSGSVHRNGSFTHRSLIICLLLFGVGGCAYSFSSGLPSHIKTVAVPLLANETSEFGIAEEITDQLVTALVKDGTLRIVNDEADATSVLVGTVRTYAEESYEYDREEKVKQFIIRIGVEVRFLDRVKDEVLWESERLFGSALYPEPPYEDTGPEARAASLGKAINQVVEEILSGMVAGW